jgi:hypothetical protein
LRYGCKQVDPNEAFLGTWSQRLRDPEGSPDLSFSLMMSGFACPSAYTY